MKRFVQISNQRFVFMLVRAVMDFSECLNAACETQGRVEGVTIKLVSACFELSRVTAVENQMSEH